MKRSYCLLLSVGLVCAVTAAQGAVSFTWLTVGNPGNAGNVETQGTFGSVATTYRIASTEVRTDQYTEFLNAVAASDLHGVFNASMDITRSVSTPYTYTVNPTFGPKPEYQRGG